MKQISAIALTSLALLGSAGVAQAAQKFELDKQHGNVEFRVKHLAISTVKGNFTDFDGGFDYDEKTGKATNIKVTIKADSIATHDKDRDDHLKSPDFFDAGKFKTLTFTAKEFTAKPGQPFKAEGELTIRDVKKPVVLEGTFNGLGKNLKGKPLIGFEAKTKINRKDFGLKWNKVLETGGLAVGEDVTIQIDLEAYVPGEEAPKAPEGGKKAETPKKG